MAEVDLGNKESKLHSATAAAALEAAAALHQYFNTPIA